MGSEMCIRDRCLFKAYEIVVLTNSIVIIVGFLFRIELFSSYRFGVRFGYKGLIPAPNETSGFYLIATCYFLEKFFNRDSNFRNLLFLFLVVSSGIMIGTKASTVILVVFAVYIIRYNRKVVRLRKAFQFLVIIGIVSLLFIYGEINEQLEISRRYFQSQLAMHGDILTVFSSGRNYKVSYIIRRISNDWSVINYLFGGFDLAAITSEVDVVDIFLLFGILGCLYFYWSYIRMLIFGNRITFSSLIFILTWLGVSSTAGHFIYSAINAPYVGILLIYINSGSALAKTNIGSAINRDKSQSVVGSVRSLRT